MSSKHTEKIPTRIRKKFAKGAQMMGSAAFAAVALASAVFCTPSSSSGGGVSAFSTPIFSDVAVRGRQQASAVKLAIVGRRGHRGAAKDERHDILLTQRIISRHIETNYMKEEDFVVKEFSVEDDDEHDGGEWSEQLAGLKALVQGETYEPALTLARDTGSRIASAETYRPILESCRPVVDGVRSAGATVASGETYRPVLDSVRSAGTRIGEACRPVVGGVRSAGGKIASGETYRPALAQIKSIGCKVGVACKTASTALTKAETYKPAIDGVKSLAHGETYKPVINGVKSLAHGETYKPVVNGVKSLAHKETYKSLGRRMRDGLRRNKDKGTSGEVAVVVAATTAFASGGLSVGTRPYVPGE